MIKLPILISDKSQKKLLLLQRNEFLSPIQKKIRKLFGRLLFTKFFIHFFQYQNLDDLVGNAIENEFDNIKKYIPKDIENVMDIGCGLGLINIFINENLKNIKKFHLLDKNKIDSKIKYGFSKNYESYNQLLLTKKILINNGVPKEKINLIDVNEHFSFKEKSVDLVISLVSMGYHYPISEYASLLKKISTNQTIFIFDLATEYQDLNILNHYFKYYEIIEKTDSKHPRYRVLCKNIF